MLHGHVFVMIGPGIDRIKKRIPDTEQERISQYNFLQHMMIKIKLRSFKSSERINEKRDGPYRRFSNSSLFSDLLN